MQEYYEENETEAWGGLEMTRRNCGTRNAQDFPAFEGYEAALFRHIYCEAARPLNW